EARHVARQRDVAAATGALLPVRELLAGLDVGRRVLVAPATVERPADVARLTGLAVGVALRVHGRPVERRVVGLVVVAGLVHVGLRVAVGGHVGGAAPEGAIGGRLVGRGVGLHPLVRGGVAVD